VVKTGENWLKLSLKVIESEQNFPKIIKIGGKLVKNGKKFELEKEIGSTLFRSDLK
jgi:hypothetical protein